MMPSSLSRNTLNALKTELLSSSSTARRSSLASNDHQKQKKLSHPVSPTIAQHNEEAKPAREQPPCFRSVSVRQMVHVDGKLSASKQLRASVQSSLLSPSSHSSGNRRRSPKSAATKPRIVVSVLAAYSPPQLPALRATKKCMNGANSASRKIRANNSDLSVSTWHSSTGFRRSSSNNLLVSSKYKPSNGKPFLRSASASQLVGDKAKPSNASLSPRPSDKNDLSALTYSPPEFPRSESMRSILCQTEESNNEATLSDLVGEKSCPQKHDISSDPLLLWGSSSMNDVFDLKTDNAIATRQTGKAPRRSSLSYSPPELPRSASVREMLHKSPSNSDIRSSRNLEWQQSSSSIGDDPPQLPSSASKRDLRCESRKSLNGSKCGRTKAHVDRLKDVPIATDCPPQLPRAASMREVLCRTYNMAEARSHDCSRQFMDTPSSADVPPQLPRSASMRDVQYNNYQANRHCSKNFPWDHKDQPSAVDSPPQRPRAASMRNVFNRSYVANQDGSRHGQNQQKNCPRKNHGVDHMSRSTSANVLLSQSHGSRHGQNQQKNCSWKNHGVDHMPHSTSANVLLSQSLRNHYNNYNNRNKNSDKNSSYNGGSQNSSRDWKTYSRNKFASIMNGFPASGCLGQVSNQSNQSDDRDTNEKPQKIPSIIQIPSDAIDEGQADRVKKDGKEQKRQQHNLSALTYSPPRFPRSESMRNILCRNFDLKLSSHSSNFLQSRSASSSHVGSISTMGSFSCQKNFDWHHDLSPPLTQFPRTGPIRNVLRRN